MASSYAVQRFLERQGSGSSTSSAGLRRNDSLDFLKEDLRKSRHKTTRGPERPEQAVVGVIERHRPATTQVT